MANYELIALNESTPQLVAPTSADTGVVSNLTVTTNLTATAGTANGVVYLNGSKVQTSGAGLRFDGTNLGLDVTPSAWASGKPALQLKNGTSLWAFDASAGHVTQNSYYNGTNWIYISTNPASRYEQISGVHKWWTAPSGTAGNAITFTEGMRLDASGNVTIGVGDLIVTTPTTPASAAAAGTVGTIAWDAGYMYVCVATDTWKRVAIAAWP